MNDQSDSDRTLDELEGQLLASLSGAGSLDESAEAVARIAEYVGTDRVAPLISILSGAIKLAAMFRSHADDVSAQLVKADAAYDRLAQLCKEVATAHDSAALAALLGTEAALERRHRPTGPRSVSGVIIRWYRDHEPASLVLPWPSFLLKLKSDITNKCIVIDGVLEIVDSLDYESATKHPDAADTGRLAFVMKGEPLPPATANALRTAHRRKC